MSKKKSRATPSAQALAAERSLTLGRMIAGFVHQFRTPLHIIASTATNIMENAVTPPMLKPELDLLHRSTERMTMMVNQLLGFAKGEPVPWTTASLNEPLNRVVDFLKEECHKRQVRLELHEDGLLPPIRMQPALLEEAILNFAMNSLEAMPRGGVLSLATQKVPATGEVRICINDTGMGMSPATLRELGQAFKTGKKAGVGLGVYFALEILKRHKAEAQFESKVGAWTIVTLTFPTDLTLV